MKNSYLEALEILAEVVNCVHSLVKFFVNISKMEHQTSYLGAKESSLCKKST